LRVRFAFLWALSVFASLETILAIIAALGVPSIVVPGTGVPGGVGGVHLQSDPIFGYSVPLSFVGWAAVGLVVFQGKVGGVRRSQVRGLFSKRGFGADTYDLMMGMRGAGSRVSLLQNMESPKHRLELSELTGIDWKEVDRQISVLEKYGLVKVYAQSGSVKLYQSTEQGKLLLNLVGELSGKRL
jgi:hypothetical protein